MQTDDVISNVKTARVSIPSISDDDSQFSQSLDEEEKAYQEQLAASQKSGSGKVKVKVRAKLKRTCPKVRLFFAQSAMRCLTTQIN